MPAAPTSDSNDILQLGAETELKIEDTYFAWIISRL